MTLTEAFPGIEQADVTILRAFDRTFDWSVDAVELLAICAIERFFKARTVLEVGTFDGGTTLNLAANLAPGGRVTTIDLPPDWDGNFRYDVPANQRVADGDAVGRQYRGTPYEASIRQVFGDSARLDWDRLGGNFDLVFIDGSHSYDYVMSDTNNALAHVRPGGVLIWHDYGMLQDVSTALDDFPGAINVRQVAGTRLAVATTPQDRPRGQPLSGTAKVS